jgi:two-component system NtrC family sensor kinase
MDSARKSVARFLAVWLITGATLFFVVYGWLDWRLARQEAERTAAQTAERIALLVESSARFAMLNNDREAIRNLVENLGQLPVVSSIQVLDQKGQPSFSAEGPPETKGARSIRVRRDIRNRPECSNAACHAHTASESVLGHIDLDFSLVTIEPQLRDHQRRQGALLGFGLLLITGFSGLIYLWGLRLEKRLEQESFELERANESLLRSEKLASLGQLAATVAHEVNNPLMGILTYARLVRKHLANLHARQPECEEMINFMQIIERESLRCGDILKNLLRFARAEAAQRTPHRLGEIIPRAIALVRHRCEMQGIAIDLRLSGELPRVICDANQIEQVMLALLVNGADVMPHGGRLTITASRQGDKEVEVRVGDNGPGVPETVRPYIFEPFFTTKQERQGTGLGLAIAQRIIGQHGGRIALDPEREQGAEFVFTLPAEETEERDAGKLAVAGKDTGR